MSRVRDKFIRDCTILIRSLGHKSVSEHRFHPTRRWRFDIAIVELKIAIEYEGIAGGRSRHTSLTGYTGDADKYNEAQLHGWMVLRFTALNTKKMSDILSRAITIADSE